MKTKPPEAEAAELLERSVERLYEFFNGRGMIDWKAKIVSRVPQTIAGSNNDVALSVAASARDIDGLLLRVMSQDRKDIRRAKKRDKRVRKGLGK